MNKYIYNSSKKKWCEYACFPIKASSALSSFIPTTWYHHLNPSWKPVHKTLDCVYLNWIQKPPHPWRLSQKGFFSRQTLYESELLNKKHLTLIKMKLKITFANRVPKVLFLWYFQYWHCSTTKKTTYLGKNINNNLKA